MSSRDAKVAGAGVVALSGCLALRKVDDFDTWWHLSAGRTIASHGIPSTDTLSHTVRDHPWVNLQWAYDLGLYGLHALGGPGLLGLAAAASFVIAIVLAFRLVRPHVGEAYGALLMLPVVLAVSERFAVRPEMLSFPLLLAVLTVLTRARQGGSRSVWLLPPLMLIWANVHALFVIGAFAIVCAALPRLRPATLRRERTFLLAAAASLAIVVVNPFGIRGALFPLKLLSRIDRSNEVFQTIAEFRSPFTADAHGIPMAAYKLLLFTGCAAAVASFALTRRRPPSAATPPETFDAGGALFFAGLAVLSIAARRNAALFALGGAPFIARSLANVAGHLPDRVRATANRSIPATAAGVIVAALILSAASVSGAFYRWDVQPMEFGLGVLESTFPTRAAAFVREAKLPGKLYNDIAMGGYLTWDDPIGDGVFIDGRLEVYDTAFISDYVAAMYDQDRWQQDADRYGLQTAIIYHRWENRRLLVQRLVTGGVWSLVYADEVACVFVRAAGNEAALARAVALNDRYNGVTRDWLMQRSRTWPYPSARADGILAFARLLATLGNGEGAVEAYRQLLALNVPRTEEIEVRLLLARWFTATGRIDDARNEARRIVALDPRNAEAGALAR